MPLAGFELMITVFKRAKTFHALDRAATVTGSSSELIFHNSITLKYVIRFTNYEVPR
jgi:hypothetical protein